MSWQRALAAQKSNHILGRIEKRGQQGEGEDSAALLYSRQTPPGILHPALEPPT